MQNRRFFKKIVKQYLRFQDAKNERYGNGTKLKRRIYLATDDAGVIKEAKDKYKNYDVLGSSDHAQSAGLSSRYTDNSLHDVVADVYFLAHCQYFVCTFSSQVNLLVLSIANNWRNVIAR